MAQSQVVPGTGTEQPHDGSAVTATAAASTSTPTPRSTSPSSSSNPPPPNESNAMTGSSVDSDGTTPRLEPEPIQHPMQGGGEQAFAQETNSSYGYSTTPSVQSSWSTSSDRQLGHGGGDYTDRVFPVRSVVSVDPGRRTSGEHDRVSASQSNCGAGSGRTGGTSSTAHAPAARPPNPRLNTEMPLKRAVTGTGTGTGTTAGRSPTPYNSGTTPRGRLSRTTTASGSWSSIQADVDRRGATSGAAILFDAVSEDDGEDSQPGNGSAQGGDGERPVSDKGQSEPIPETHYAQRFKHVITDDGHAVITGRDGKLQTCEDEPIHTPGAVQGFGLLVAIKEEPPGNFSVRCVSENSERIIGYTPSELFRLTNFLDILTEEQAENLLDHIDFIRDEDADPSVNGPEVFSLTVRPPSRLKKKSVKLWCAIHINPAHRDLVICEFELDDDHDYPLRPSDEMTTPDIPEDTLRANPTMEELTESTEILSKPLRVLRSARKRRGEAGAMQVFDIMGQVQEQLASASSLDMFLKILVGIVKELTGFHRVMIYQFDSTFNGKVVTELVDPVKTRDLYKGLHFPATDIPKQARELYKLNKVRLLYDREMETARIVCRSVEDLEVPLDMSHSYLRAMSPIHLKYLGHMAVRSSMSISINAFGELWGLIACHSYGNKGMRVSFPIRKMCRLVGDTASRNIERLSYASRLQARKLINTAPTDKNPSGYIIASSDDLLKLFDADFGMLNIRGETKILGKLEHTQEALAMLEYLRLRKFTSVITTQDVRIDFPDLRYPPGFSVIAGLLYVPLSVGGSDFIVFFRRGQVREVKWAGNPYEKVLHEGTVGFLEPRKSFKAWHETVAGKCREWTEEQVETAAVLCLVYGKFIEVWRQKEAALQNSRLTRLLLANSAHEVRTPLNAIINYLEIALEGSLDQETRDNLARSHSASKSLIYVINDLLDLTKTEEGNDLIKDEVFDLPACIREATQPFETDAKRKGIAYEVVEYPGLPRWVYGDQRRVRQAVTNLTANAVQSTTEGSVRIELYVVEVQDRHVRIEIVVQDTGKGMSDKKVDAIFRDLEQVTTDMDEEDSIKGAEDTKPKTKTLGLGLAVVARFVRNMDGQLRLKSEEGKGSRFVVQLPFELPLEGSTEMGSSESMAGASTSAVSSLASVSTSMPPSQAGEVTLVDRGSIHSTANNNVSGSSSEHKTLDDSGSIKSQHSEPSGISGKSGRSGRSVLSDADWLIGALNTSFNLGEPGSGTGGDQRSDRASSRPPFTPSLSFSQRERPQPKPLGRYSPVNSADSTDSAATDDTVVPQPSPGGVQVVDSRMPVKAVKMPNSEEYFDIPRQPNATPSTPGPRTLFELSESEGRKTTDQTHAASSVAEGSVSSKAPSGLRLLIAEDDPINMKILRKRLEKAGHVVFHAVNGEDCHAMYAERSGAFDAILMDMQMPIVDGLTSTTMIRDTEHRRPMVLSPVASRHGRIPVIAVSASLVEKEKDTYMEAGFDGWILKPIDFRRLETLLSGAVDDGVRDAELYVPGEWERGGWFGRRRELVRQ